MLVFPLLYVCHVLNRVVLASVVCRLHRRPGSDSVSGWAVLWLFIYMSLFFCLCPVDRNIVACFCCGVKVPLHILIMDRGNDPLGHALLDHIRRRPQCAYAQALSPVSEVGFFHICSNDQEFINCSYQWRSISALESGGGFGLLLLFVLARVHERKVQSTWT